MNGKLSLKIIKRVEFVSGIKIFIVFAVGTFYLTVMARGERTDQFVGNLSLFERTLKERKITGRRAAETLGKFKAIISLNTIHSKS